MGVLVEAQSVSEVLAGAWRGLGGKVSNAARF